MELIKCSEVGAIALAVESASERSARSSEKWAQPLPLPLPLLSLVGLFQHVQPALLPPAAAMSVFAVKRVFEKGDLPPGSRQASRALPEILSDTREPCEITYLYYK